MATTKTAKCPKPQEDMIEDIYSKAGIIVSNQDYHGQTLTAILHKLNNDSEASTKAVGQIVQVIDAVNKNLDSLSTKANIMAKQSDNWFEDASKKLAGIGTSLDCCKNLLVSIQKICRIRMFISVYLALVLTLMIIIDLFS